MVRWVSCACLCLVTLLVASFSQAQQELDSIVDKPQLVLGDLLRLAELKNPELAAARATVAVYAGDARQAGLYPNPHIAFEVEDLDTDDPDIRTHKFSLEQRLVISGRRGKRSSVRPRRSGSRSS